MTGEFPAQMASSAENFSIDDVFVLKRKFCILIEIETNFALVRPIYNKSYMLPAMAKHLKYDKSLPGQTTRQQTRTSLA